MQEAVQCFCGMEGGVFFGGAGVAQVRRVYAQRQVEDDRRARGEGKKRKVVASKAQRMRCTPDHLVILQIIFGELAFGFLHALGDVFGDGSTIKSLDRRSFKKLECACELDRKSTRLNSSHVAISYAVFCLKKKKK